MGKAIHMPNAASVSRIEPHRRFIGLVVLLAACDAALRVRFERCRDQWRVYFGMADGDWYEQVPVVAEAAVDRTIRVLTQPSWAIWFSVKLGAVPAPPAFEVQLDNCGLVCRVVEDEAYIGLSLEQFGEVRAQASEIVQEYWRMIGKLDGSDA